MGKQVIKPVPPKKPYEVKPKREWLIERADALIKGIRLYIDSNLPAIAFKWSIELADVLRDLKEVEEK